MRKEEQLWKIIAGENLEEIAEELLEKEIQSKIKKRTRISEIERKFSNKIRKIAHYFGIHTFEGIVFAHSHNLFVVRCKVCGLMRVKKLFPDHWTIFKGSLWALTTLLGLWCFLLSGDLVMKSIFFVGLSFQLYLAIKTLLEN